MGIFLREFLKELPGVIVALAIVAFFVLWIGATMLAHERCEGVVVADQLGWPVCVEPR
jgi:hypothetical protein